jgi:hypothetical protein
MSLQTGIEASSSGVSGFLRLHVKLYFLANEVNICGYP